MTLSLTALRTLQHLAEGQTIAASSMKGAWVNALLDEEAIHTIARGSHKSYRASSATHLLNAIEARLGISNIEAHIQLLENATASRAEAVAATGNSKARQVRTFCGFLVNTLSAVEASLNGVDISIAPPEGSFMFVADYEKFRIPPHVVVVGIENSENFRHLRRQREFFRKHLPEHCPVLFVSRYPQNGDLVRWLSAISNRYIHFGDLDLAGINIYLSEFFAKLGDRASFLIPENYSELLSRGSRERYDVQLPHYPRLAPGITPADPRVAPLIAAIHATHRGFDQEGFCSLCEE